jgi:hypothetical protein
MTALRSISAVLFALAAAPPPATAAEPVSFAREVVPVLTKAGCNAGACHGTPTGKNGFRLSLRGYDPAVDIQALTRDMAGRRIDRIDPDRSLLLLKATAREPHEGGRRIDPDGELYRLLRDWIVQGTPDDRGHMPRPVALTVTPAQSVVDAPTAAQQLHVVAAFPDGSKRDVTRLSRFTVSDELAARVGLDGTVSKLKPGEVVVVAEYMGLMTPATVLFRDPKPDFRWPDPPEWNYVDTHVFAKLKVLQIEPAPLCTDTEFVRRAHLDAAGRLPTPDEVRSFLADPDPKKRVKLIDHLLALPEFADWWALKWADRLGVNQRFVGKIGAIKYHQWVRGQIAANVPEDEFARTILTAAGPNYANPPAGFFRRLRDPQLRAEEIAQLFMGVRIGCAKCHNHPGENWTRSSCRFTTRRKRSSRGATPSSPTRGPGRRWPRSSPAGRSPGSRRRAIAAARSRTGSRPRTTRTSRGRPPTASGSTCSAAASWTRWTTSAAPTRRASRRCWTPSPPIW